MKDGVARFTFAHTARHVRVVSRTFVPADWASSDDRRALGLAVRAITIGDATRMTAVDLADPRLAPGFHTAPHPDGNARESVGEGVSWRWTRGVLSLPCGLWQPAATQVARRDTGGRNASGRDAGGRDIVLCVEFDPAASQCWVLPAPPQRLFRPETAARRARRRGDARHCASGDAAFAS